MNQFTRQLVYSSITFAVTALCVQADPINLNPGREASAPNQQRRQSTESVPLADQVTQSSFSSGERLEVKNTFSTPRATGAGLGLTTQDGVAMFTPSSGKVVALENWSTPMSQASQSTVAADITTTDSVSDGATSGPPANGNDVVSDAIADVTQTIDPNNLSIATTTTSADLTSASSGAASGSGSGFDPITVSGTPEPASLMTSGSMLLGLALFLAARRKHA